MRIQHNIAALNSYRQLNGNNNALSKNLEKLSSGYRINRAGDDAAGLAISEKMRSQIKGLEAAQKNANDGISLVQTAEGALTEVHSMLNRMTYLATQSANGTYDDKVDRANLQKEVKSLLSEIDRVSEATNFNGINLLDGSLGGPKVETTAGTAPTMVTSTNVPTGTDITVTGTDGQDGTKAATLKLQFGDVTLKEGQTGATAEYSIGGNTVTISLKADKADGKTMSKEAVAAAVAKALGDGELTVGTGKATITGNTAGAITLTSTQQKTAESWSTVPTGYGTGGKITATLTNGQEPQAGTGSETKTEINFDGRTGEDVIGGTITIGGTKFEFVEDGGAAKDATAEVIDVAKTDTAADLATKFQAAIGGLHDKIKTDDAGEWTAGAVNAGDTSVTLTAQKKGALEAPKMQFSGFGVNLQVGDTSDKFNKVKVSVDSMSSASLGIDKIDITTQTGASDAIKKIKDAINSVSSTRGDLGAVQNRLEHTINNLGVTTENITAAESRIRDTDMADEMMAYTKNNILVQAAQAMLAQANQVPQGVLQLLQ